MSVKCKHVRTWRTEIGGYPLLHDCTHVLQQLPVLKLPQTLDQVPPGRPAGANLAAPPVQQLKRFVVVFAVVLVDAVDFDVVQAQTGTHRRNGMRNAADGVQVFSLTRDFQPFLHLFEISGSHVRVLYAVFDLLGVRIARYLLHCRKLVVASKYAGVYVLRFRLACN